MSETKPIVGYAVYPPPFPGLPYLAVTFLPDGKVEARRFESGEAAASYADELAKGRRPQSTKH
ncbi:MULTISPECIES: hypothetical protein [Aminobacter]|uniref:hypothetical protein n=1 Tax=Aminobacter TaxID=31988 RepID=UPI000D367649|nr:MULTISPECIES: hypothetical protein [Aminobacter]AWC21392.1 hypothetical protein CO731_00843 [Aminobacter sp. MSH1]AWC25608.1 hypothetical protein CO731_05107 [Aminobacter sp. MSH1]CAI2936256.1 conserved protein of unknown function [Aminobacter niigataensis]